MRDKPQPVNEEYLHYWKRSRTLSHSLIAVLPLLVLYQVWIVQANYGQRLLVEVWLAGAMREMRLDSAGLMNAVLIGGVVAALWRSERTGRFCPHVIFIMWAEAAFFALALYKSSTVITMYLLGLKEGLVFAAGMDALRPIVLGLGAGVYEEFAFRFLLVGMGGLLLNRMFEWSKPLCFGIMILVSSILFSFVHHLGGSGDPMQFDIFLFRAVCGALLGVLFVTRGFGVAAWTHALYNAMVIWQVGY